METSLENNWPQNPMIYSSTYNQTSLSSLENSQKFQHKNSNSIKSLVTQVLALKSTLDETETLSINKQNN